MLATDDSYEIQSNNELDSCHENLKREAGKNGE